MAGSSEELLRDLQRFRECEGLTAPRLPRGAAWRVHSLGACAGCDCGRHDAPAPAAGGGMRCGPAGGEPEQRQSMRWEDAGYTAGEDWKLVRAFQARPDDPLQRCRMVATALPHEDR